MPSLEIPVIHPEHQKRLNRKTGLAGATTVDTAAGDQTHPGLLRRLARGIADGERSRWAAADLRRIRL